MSQDSQPHLKRAGLPRKLSYQSSVEILEPFTFASKQERLLQWRGNNFTEPRHVGQKLKTIHETHESARTKSSFRVVRVIRGFVRADERQNSRRRRVNAVYSLLRSGF